MAGANFALVEEGSGGAHLPTLAAARACGAAPGFFEIGIEVKGRIADVVAQQAETPRIVPFTIFHRLSSLGRGGGVKTGMIAP